MAVVDFFLKIDGIDGESKDDKHKDWIEVTSFQMGATNAGSSALGGGGGAGKVKIHDVVVMKNVDKATPKLYEACNSGKHISKVELSCRKQGGSQQEYYKVTMSDVLISGVATAGCPIGRRRHEALTVKGGAAQSPSVPVPTEQMSLNFGKIEWEYKEQDSKGNAKGPVKAGWDIKANKKV